ncbi:MAG TPA: tetratricopeptide repeat protein [Pyrinomonadaceae bacterium]|jgi:Tfp pilus assembly protein PilF
MVIAYNTVNLGRLILLLVAVGLLTVMLGRGVYSAQSAVASKGNKISRVEQAERLVAEGAAAFERGEVTAARDLFQKALELNPASVTAHTQLGMLADNAGDLEEAARHFGRAARLEPSSSSARNNYGVILQRLGRTREAAAEFEASLRADARQPNALVNLGQIRFAGGTPTDLRAAADLFARAYEIAPDTGIARAQTVIALRRKDPSAAAVHYRHYATLLGNEGAAAVEELGARGELGGALLEAGLLAEAEAELSAVVKLDPSNADTIVQLARVYLARQDIPAAGRLLEAAVARGLESAPVYSLLADVYERSGHLENAIPAMRLAIQRDPQSEKYRFAYGLLLTNAYAPAAAVIRLEEALKTFPNSSPLWFALGLAHFKNENNEKAEEAFRHSQELNPNFASALAYRGMIRVRTGAAAEGITLYEDALRVDPKITVVHYLIADALLKQVDADLARVETHLKRAVESDSTFTPARISLAKLFMRTGRWEEAAVELEQVIKLDANLADAYYQLGRTYTRLKRTAEAQSTLATFKRLSETQKERDEKDLRAVVKRLSDVRF